MVGGSKQRGVVAAASYEAREYGVRSAMPASTARRLCPEGVFLPSRFERYREVSKTIFDIFRRYTENIEPVSLDEAYLDLSKLALQGDAEFERFGRQLKNNVARETGLTASVGMAHNKLLAKLASDYDKPDGLVYIAPGSVHRTIDPLPIRRLPGVGPRTAERLQTAGILTIGQLRASSLNLLEALVGNHAIDLQRRAYGEDHRAVEAERHRRSVSQETTFDKNHTTVETLYPVIQTQAEQIAQKLVAKGLLAKTVNIKIRSTGFSTTTRSQTLSTPTNQADHLSDAALVLLEDWAHWRTAFSIRLFGIGVSLLSHSIEPELE